MEPNPFDEAAFPIKMQTNLVLFRLFESFRKYTRNHYIFFNYFYAMIAKLYYEIPMRNFIIIHVVRYLCFDGINLLETIFFCRKVKIFKDIGNLNSD